MCARKGSELTLAAFVFFSVTAAPTVTLVSRLHLDQR
jgi:hypothetical protein